MGMDDYSIQLKDNATFKKVVEKIYDTYSFIGISLGDFYLLIGEIINESVKSYKGKDNFIDYVSVAIKKNLEDKVKALLDNSECDFDIVNNYINSKFNANSSYNIVFKQVKNLVEFFDKHKFIPSPSFIIELLNKNKAFYNSINYIVQKKYDLIKDGKMDNIFNSEILSEIIGIFCMVNKIEIKPSLEEEEIDSSMGTVLNSYLNEIGKYPILSQEEVIDLCQKIENHDEEARQEFINRNLKLSVSVAKRYSWIGVPLMDIINYGNLGLIEAVDRFDYKKGYKFSTYAVHWIRREIYTGLTESNRFIKVPFSQAKLLRKYAKANRELQEKLGRIPSDEELANEIGVDLIELGELKKINGDVTISLNEYIGESEGELGEFVSNEEDGPEEMVISKYLPQRIKELFDNCNLNQNEKLVLIYRFGLNGVEPKTLEELGSVLNLTKERIRQIQERAIIKIRFSSYIKNFAVYMDNPEKALEYIKISSSKKSLYDYDSRPSKKPKPKSIIKKENLPLKEEFVPIEEKIIIGAIKKVEDAKEDSVEITNEDLDRLYQLMNVPQLHGLQSVLTTRRLIIVLLNSGIINEKIFSISTIAKYLNMEENDIKTALDSANKHYGNYIKLILSNLPKTNNNEGIKR